MESVYESVNNFYIKAKEAFRKHKEALVLYEPVDSILLEPKFPARSIFTFAPFFYGTARLPVCIVDNIIIYIDSINELYAGKLHKDKVRGQLQYIGDANVILGGVCYDDIDDLISKYKAAKHIQELQG